MSFTSIRVNNANASDHNYDATEPPAFVIKQITQQNMETQTHETNLKAQVRRQALEIGNRLLTATSISALPILDVISETNRCNAIAANSLTNQVNVQQDCGMRRVRRSEDVLRRAAECVRGGQTFQTVSDQFGIPISTIRFFMARKGILPKRRRGRASLIVQDSQTSSTEPYYTGHFFRSRDTSERNSESNDDSTP